MHIEPVIPDFDYVTIRRTGGILGVDDTIQFDRNLDTTITSRHTGDRVFVADAHASQELLHALARLVEVNPAPSPRRGFDLFHYDVQLSIGGRIHTFHSVDLGAHEALHGVILAAERLTAADPTRLHPMELHLESAGTA